MPLQNRVDPYGVIFRSPARGAMMGNRGGAIHNPQREIVRPFLNRRWIACLLEFKDRHRTVMSPGRYTELFFLDEAVALSAGHRPCAECRHDRFIAFRNAWLRCDHADSRMPLRAPEMDADLHAARIDRHRNKVTYQAALNPLPNGCFIEFDGSPWLIWDDALLLWTPERYAKKRPRPTGVTVTVLTPRPIVECLRRGYTPDLHDSRRAL